VIVMGSFQDLPQHRRATLEAVRSLSRTRTLDQVIRRPQIRVWVFR
jgi:hypothetical protein